MSRRQYSHHHWIIIRLNPTTQKEGADHNNGDEQERLPRQAVILPPRPHNGEPDDIWAYFDRVLLAMHMEDTYPQPLSTAETRLMMMIAHLQSCGRRTVN